MFGETHGAGIAEPADGTGQDKRVRRPGPSVPVAHVRHGPRRGARVWPMVRLTDDRRVGVPGHARAGSGRRRRPQGPDRRVHGSETPAVEVRCPGERSAEELMSSSSSCIVEPELCSSFFFFFYGIFLSC